MSKHFSRETLAKFEDAAAGIPLRPLDRAFTAVAISPGEDPGGVPGSRKVQFRRYIAGVRQSDPSDVEKLCIALGTLVGEVATSKVPFLVGAALGDGFTFADGRFRAEVLSADAFAVHEFDGRAAVEERTRRLYALATEHPRLAVDGANVLVSSLCRAARQLGKKAHPSTNDLETLASLALEALDPTATSIGTELIAAVVRISKRSNLDAKEARYGVAAASAFALYVAESLEARASFSRSS